MKYYTLNDIMELNPCHSRDKLEVYMEGRKRISLSGILSSKASDADKIWLVSRLLPVDKTVEFAKWCADSVSHIDDMGAAGAADAAREARGAATRAAWSAAFWTTRAAWSAAWSAARDGYAEGYDARDAHKNQITQLKLIVKENKL